MSCRSLFDFRFSIFAGSRTLCVLVILLGAAARAEEPGGAALTPAVDVMPPARTPEELETRYQQVLAVVKNPAAPGALVLETAPESAGRAAGLWPGDIITRYDDRAIEGDQELRAAIADAIAPQAEQLYVIDVRVPVLVRRGPQAVALRVPKGPLGLTIITVAAGVAGPRNPPATPREKLRLEWDRLHQNPRRIAEMWTLLEWHQKPYAMECSILALHPEAAELTVNTTELDGHAARCRIEFVPGDNQLAPALATTALSYRGALAVTAVRRGRTVRGTISPAGEAPAAVEFPTTPDAVPAYATATLAAALPHETGLVLPLAQLSELDLQTRLGYCLCTRSAATVTRDSGNTAGTPAATSPATWCVQLLHFGRPEITYWFNDQRALLHADLGMGLQATAATPEQVAQFKARQE